MLEVVDHLLTEFILDGLTALVFVVFFDRLLSHGALLAHSRVHVAQSCEFDPIADRVPLEVEHRMHGLNFDPPAPLLEGISDQSRVVPVPDNELVAVLDVRVFKGDLAHGSLEDMCVLPAKLTLVTVRGLHGLLVLLELHGVQVVRELVRRRCVQTCHLVVVVVVVVMLVVQ